MCRRKRRREYRQQLACVVVITGVSFAVYVISTTLMSTTSTESVGAANSHDRVHPPLYSDDSINPHPYHFTIANPNHCQSAAGQPYLVILVKAAPSDVYDRQQIRQTWGGTRTVGEELTTTLFLLGLNENADVNKKVQEESRLYNDIVQENFIDAYQNLTIKNIMGMKWIATFCSNASFVASADADVMLNTFNLVNRLLNKPRQRYAEGSLRRNVVPVRKARVYDKKWLTSKELYPEATYAPFFPGSCFVVSSDVASDIYHESQHVRYLPWDDVFIGLVMKRVGIEPTHAKGYEQYVRLDNKHSILNGLIRGIAVLIPHQEDGVDEKLVELWKSATSMSERKLHRINDPSSLQIILIGIVIGVILVLACIAGFALMMM